jgi:flagellar biosynthesis protein FliR
MEHYALASQVYGGALIFARLGSFFVAMPGVGESTVPANIRLAFAFIVTLALYPALAGSLPAEPSDIWAMAFQITAEIVIGLAFGTLLRMFTQSLAVAGEIVSLQTTLSFAQTTNPLQAQPTASVTTFLTLVGMTVIFATNLHQLFIVGIVHSYQTFPPGHGVPLDRFNAAAVRVMGDTFALGVQLAAPVLVFSLVFNIAAGLVARVMPQFQVFFIAAPLTVLLGLAVFAISLGGLGMVWLEHYRAFAEQWI